MSNKGKILEKNYRGKGIERILQTDKGDQIKLSGKSFSIRKLVSEIFKDAKK